MSRVLAIFLIGALAAGCTPGRIDRIRVESGYDPQQYRFVPYTKALKADISGNPFGIDQQTFNALVSETIQPPGIVESDASPYRVRLAFNGSTGVNKDLACRASGGGPTSGDMTLVAALCPGSGSALTFLTGSVSGISGPDDPRFRKFVRSAVVKLFPGPRPDDRNDRDVCLIPGCWWDGQRARGFQRTTAILGYRRWAGDGEQQMILIHPDYEFVQTMRQPVELTKLALSL